MVQKIGVDVSSEIGDLEAVVIHTPGNEVENMTPQNAERALYSDILNLSIAKKEYSQLSDVLRKFAKVYEIKDLLDEVLSNERVKATLVDKICNNEGFHDIRDYLISRPPSELARMLIEGVILKKDTLTRFLSKDRYSLPPLHNFFFTRDSAVSIFDQVMITKMANKVRERESLIMEAIFDYGNMFSTKTFNPYQDSNYNNSIMIEGGDVLVAREDIILIGYGARTSTQGIDYILGKLKGLKEKKLHVIVQELPLHPESFIHLDMVFTLLDKGDCMVYEPVVFRTNKYQTVHITIENGTVSCIKEEKNMVEVLRNLGMDLNPIVCGGTRDPWIQEREQWHSGANFFSIAPGKVIGYERNVYTMEEMNKNGYEIIKAADILSNKVDHTKIAKFVIALEGSELPRGGGGARCMTMPVKRKAVKW
jgi:arginine deiminase